MKESGMLIEGVRRRERWMRRERGGGKRERRKIVRCVCLKWCETFTYACGLCVCVLAEWEAE